MGRLELSALSAELHGVVAQAQAQWHMQRARAALGHDDWARALEALMPLARLGTEQHLTATAWRELLGEMVWLGVRGQLKDALSEVFDQYIWLGWSGRSAEGQPWALSRALVEAEQRGVWSTGAHVGDLLGRIYPTCALGPYASAHFRELEQLAQRDPRAMAAQAQANASRFARAQSLAEDTRYEALARHCALRRGVAQLLGGAEQDQGRRLLKALARQDLSPEERMWYALGMARSAFWLDRVRALDTLDALAQDVRARRPGYHDLPLARLQEVVQFALDQEPPGALHDTEEERLRELIDEVFQGDEAARTAQLDTLELRLKLAETTNQPLAEADPIIALLHARATHLGDEAWARAAASVELLRAHLTDADAPPAPERAGEDDPLRFAHIAIDLLRADRQDDAHALEAALRRAHHALVSPGRASQPAALVPLASVWPTLLRRAAVKLPRDADEAAQHAHATLSELTGDALAAWSRHAPRPSYGWWPLAAHALAAKLGHAADMAGRRAIAERESAEAALRDRVIGGMLAWTGQRGDRVQLLRWLEIAEAAYAEAT